MATITSEKPEGVEVEAVQTYKSDLPEVDEERVKQEKKVT
jgi:hypothetical protein